MFLIHLSKNREEKKTKLKMLSKQDVKKNDLLTPWLI